MKKHHLRSARFDHIAASLVRSERSIIIPQRPKTLKLISGDDHDLEGSQMVAFSSEKIQMAWNIQVYTTKEDWAEWMRQFSVVLLKESPCPPLRACWELAQLQPHVARELFAAGFVSVWPNLPATEREELIEHLKTSWASPNFPPEMMANILNLAEFMGHDEKPLPMPNEQLYQLAIKCHAYAKALHFKELDFAQIQLEREQETARLKAVLLRLWRHPELPELTLERTDCESRLARLKRDHHKAVQDLIHVNMLLQLPEAAQGILDFCPSIDIILDMEAWWEKLRSWDKALRAYEAKAAAPTGPGDPAMERQLLLGQMRCHAALGQWKKVQELSKMWGKGDRGPIASMAAKAAWRLRDWKAMAEDLAVLDTIAAAPPAAEEDQSGDDTMTGRHEASFYRAIICVHQLFVEDDKTKADKILETAKKYIDEARSLLALDMAALVMESYERAYNEMVRVQQLAELEEVIEHWSLQKPELEPLCAHEREGRIHLIEKMWHRRIRGVQQSIEVWQAILSVRYLILPPENDVMTNIKFATLFRKNGRVQQAEDTFSMLLRGPYGEAPALKLAHLKHRWALATDREEQVNTFLELEDLKNKLESSQQLGSSSRRVIYPGGQEAISNARELPRLILPHQQLGGVQDPSSSSSGINIVGLEHEEANMCLMKKLGDGNLAGASYVYRPEPTALLAARIHLKLGLWGQRLLQPPPDSGHSNDDIMMSRIHESLTRATCLAPHWSKTWHEWSMFNTALSEALEAPHSSPLAAEKKKQQLLHIQLAIDGFFAAIALNPEQGEANLQDILRLLTLWFTYGDHEGVNATLKEGFKRTRVETWLLVIPQIIARIHCNLDGVKSITQDLLIQIGEEHPQAVMYSLFVVATSLSSHRRAAAGTLIQKLREHHPRLVAQADMVTKEFNKMAILWHEEWHETLEEASRLFHGERNIEAFLRTVMPLHQALEERQGNLETENERSFARMYGQELWEANQCCLEYRESRREEKLNQAWDLYCTVFKKIHKQLQNLKTLDLQSVAPALVKGLAEARGRYESLELAVPGTYRAGEEVVTIVSIAPQIVVIPSKQRPRRFEIEGSNGIVYGFLLKGHEDLRQDERVMQLFGLVNTVLGKARKTSEKDLAIQRYSVTPLSHNSGLIGWVPNHDTFDELIRKYRESKKIAVNVEHRHMVAFAPDFDHLPLLAKMEVFEHALEMTRGDDLANVLWLKSRSSEVWLQRRTNFTQSLAVMSMVGYLLGLGDRHPRNLMLDRQSGKITHIDFGDCFEVAMNREKFPEKVPFRLTRMLVKAMGVSGTEGNFRSTCESTMEVLRTHRDSIVALMEAFLYDPLLNWRLIGLLHVPNMQVVETVTPARVGAEEDRMGPEGAAAAATAASPPQPPEPALMLQRRPRPERAENERQTLQLVGNFQYRGELLQEKAENVVDQMRRKLTGHDFGPVPPPSTSTGMPLLAGPRQQRSSSVQDPELGLAVAEQVKKLIAQATSHENLCQSYIGWCPFW